MNIIKVFNGSVCYYLFSESFTSFITNTYSWFILTICFLWSFGLLLRVVLFAITGITATYIEYKNLFMSS